MKTIISFLLFISLVACSCCDPDPMIEYQIGDTHPDGGTVAVVDEDGQHGLIVSDVLGTYQWAPTNDPINTTTLDDGEFNTAEIVSVLGAGTYAAKVCQDLGPGWFLPSYQEMNDIRMNMGDPETFWTSTETPGLTSQAVTVPGPNANREKSMLLSVRAAKRF